MPLIARDVSYRYAGVAESVVRELSLDVASGEVVALCGAARSGRSTVLALLAGLQAPQSGSIAVDGTPVTAHAARGRVGLLLQNADEALFGLTVREDVMFAPLQEGLAPQEAGARADDALRAVDLDPAQFATRSPFSLSGGQRRRAAVAGIMAMDPAYLLLDEPFVGLDPQGRGEIASVIRSIGTRGFGRHTGILVALSSLYLALHLADKLAVLHAGRIVWRGGVADYLAAPPDVAPWGLHQPELVALAEGLRGQGWRLPVDGPDADALAVSIVRHVREVRR